MSIRIPGKLIYLRHARTGSNAVANALMKIGGYECGHGHEPFDATDGELTITTLRNPYDMLASWFCVNGCVSGCATMGEMLASFSHSYFTRCGHLFYMAGWCEWFLRYETLDKDFRLLLKRLQLPQVALERVNETPGKLADFMNYFTESDVLLVEEKFADDLALWRSL